MRLAEQTYNRLSQIRGPLLFLDKVWAVRMGETVSIEAPDGSVREGEVLQIDGETVMVQVFGESRGLSGLLGFTLRRHLIDRFRPRLPRRGLGRLARTGSFRRQRRRRLVHQKCSDRHVSLPAGAPGVG